MWALNSMRIDAALARLQDRRRLRRRASSSVTEWICASPLPQRAPISSGLDRASWLAPVYDCTTSAACPSILSSPNSIQAARLAELLDLAEAVADEHDRAAVLAELLDLLHAATLERLVADREDLVDEQDLGFDVGGDGEPEPDGHARRVVLHRRVDELLEPGERHDVVEASGDLLARHPEDRAVQVDVLDAGQLGVEAGAELEQGGEAPVRRDRARLGEQDARRGT